MFTITERNGNWYVVNPDGKLITQFAYGTVDAVLDAADSLEAQHALWAARGLATR
ncbi:hypothetical protein ACIBKZ_15735 [Streptomyces sp. NPDC050421]|uniref:hypothetical protein n=1 Tax=Streptomyces sp. NPDC050421 TaxID=3365613 RepID=UPI0037A55C76